MRTTKKNFVDPSGAILGLGSGDLFDLKLPAFQRGLKWDDGRLKGFHDSLIQGWPMGVIVIAIQSSELLNVETGQRKYTLSLIDGQQRSWALSKLVGEFWSEPWFMFASTKWDSVGPAAGSITNAKTAAVSLAAVLDLDHHHLEDAVRAVSKARGQAVFDDYQDFLEALEAYLELDDPAGKSARPHARDLCKALLAQFEELKTIPVPTLLLTEALRDQLPSVFRRLNDGVPLKGYDLLAAIWESASLVNHGQTPPKAQEDFLRSVLEVAEQRILGTYSKLGSGYEIDPNLDGLEVADLSLFDLLYFLSSKLSRIEPFSTSSEVLAFQTSALLFRGSISKVDDELREAFPVQDGRPDVVVLPVLFMEAGKAISDALKPFMAVTSSNLTVRGRVGLTPAVVYLATFLSHHTRVEHETASRLALRRRAASADDRLVASGVFMNSTDRLAALKRSLPAWYVHDSLTSVFSGSRAYEAANDRVWEQFREPGKKGAFRLRPSNQMLAHPPLIDLLDAFEQLWVSEIQVEKTPLRRRVSDGGSVLLRAAYSHLHVHDFHIDHVLPYSKGKASADTLNAHYPLNHIANLMPLEAAINSKRADQDWEPFLKTIPSRDQKAAAALLMTDPADAAADRLATLDAFHGFLRQRFRALVSQALVNLKHEEWAALDATGRTEQLDKIAL